MSHQMIHLFTDDTGAEHWHCPECERYLVITWPPNYSKEVVEVGNDTEEHSGGRGGLNISMEINIVD